MGHDSEPAKKGLFGYEGEGFDMDGEDSPESEPRERSAARGWNIGREDDRPASPPETPGD